MAADPTKAGQDPVAGCPTTEEPFDAASALAQFYPAMKDAIGALPAGMSEQQFKTHNDLPLARIKRIMKADEDVRMISAEAPVLFAKAVELFVVDMTMRAWYYSSRDESRKKTLSKADIQRALLDTPYFDFLVDIIGEPGQDRGPEPALIDT